MAYTSHGHHMPGTTMGRFQTLPNAMRCGGVTICDRCKREYESSMAYMVGENTDYPEKAKAIVRKYVDDVLDLRRIGGEEIPEYGVYVVWFTKTLQNWKAMVSTTLPDNMYYEVTHNGEKKETYLDPYQKVENIVIPDPKED